jgi:hypothetical protein
VQRDDATEPYPRRRVTQDQLQRTVLAADLGFGGIAASEAGAPKIFANLVRSGWAVVRGDNATEP